MNKSLTLAAAFAGIVVMTGRPLEAQDATAQPATMVTLDQQSADENIRLFRKDVRSLEALRVERPTAIRLRNESRINDEVLRHIERELDLTESRLTLVSAEAALPLEWPVPSPPPTNRCRRGSS
jgi:hypothetical protein